VGLSRVNPVEFWLYPVPENNNNASLHHIENFVQVKSEIYFGV
jgi:hypothetical protein